MIRFLTLLLGLVIGPWPVTLDVGPGVARVDLLLDGVEVARVTGEPWQATVDLGAELAPHHLVAVARDASGTEVGRAEQWINLGPVPLEVELAIERDEAGRPVAARVVWQSVEDLTLERVTMTLDGVPLPLDARHRAELPALPEGTVAVLHAEVMLDGGAAAQAGRLLGGVYGEQSDVGLTTVALRVGRRLPGGAGELPWLRAGGQPAAAMAVERGDADLLVVVDRTALPELGDFRARYERWVINRVKSVRSLDAADQGVKPELTLLSGGIHPGDRVWYVVPEAERVRPTSSPGAASNPAPSPTSSPTSAPASPPASTSTPASATTSASTPASAPASTPAGPEAAWLFRRFGPFGVEQGGLPNHLVRFRLPPETGPQRLADAVATAGRAAYGSGRPRAVLAVVGPGLEDASVHRFQAVRRYLASLGVPLHVWYVEQGKGRRYDRELRAAGQPAGDRASRLAAAERLLGPLHDVASVPALLSATGALRTDLDGQQIVWIKGRFLPSDVTLAGAPPGVALATDAAP